MNKQSSKNYYSFAILCCVGTLICWTSAPLFIKYLTIYLDLWTQNLLRYIAACLFWLPFLFASLKAGKVPKVVWKRALLPFIPNIIMQNMWAAAFYFINPGFASLLSNTAFLWVIILSVLFFADERQRLKSRQFGLSVLFSIIGVIGLMVFHPAFKSHTLVGTFIMLVYGFIWGIYAILVKKYFRGIDSRIGFSVVSIYTVIALFILILFKGNPAQCLDMPIGGWLSIIISGILGIAVGHVTYYISIRRLGPMTPSLIQLVQPFIVIVFSYFIFGESLSIPQMIFGIILIGGSAMAITAEKDNSPQVV